MFGRWVSRWRDWFGGTSACAVLPSSSSLERRVWVRYPSQTFTKYQPGRAPTDSEEFSARIQNVSRGGINLIVDRQLTAGEYLQICLPDVEERSPAAVTAYVMRVAPHSDVEWAIGCTFAGELTREDLEMLGGRHARPAAADKRAWVRFAADAEARYCLLRNGKMVPLTGRVVDISAGGIALDVDVPVELGAVLNVELTASERQLTLTLLACVVRVQARENNRCLLGCNFIREMTDEELQAWLVATSPPNEAAPNNCDKTHPAR